MQFLSLFGGRAIRKHFSVHMIYLALVSKAPYFRHISNQVSGHFAFQSLPTKAEDNYSVEHLILGYYRIAQHMGKVIWLYVE